MPNHVQDLITSRTETISTDFEVKPSRITALLNKAQESYSHTEVIDESTFLSYYAALLNNALQNWPKEEALRYFESHTPSEIAINSILFYQLFQAEQPLLSIEELEAQTASLLESLMENKSHLIEYGLPQKTFNGSQWLEIKLLKLYHTREYCVIAPLTREDPQRIIYDWDISSLKIKHSELLEEYKSKPLLYGLQADEEKHLIRLRGCVFDLKIEIIRKLHRALRMRSGENLIRDCLRLINDNLSGADVDFLLKIDSIYLNSNLENVSNIRNTPDAPGGLTDLISVILHYESELVIGAFSRTKSRLGNLLLISSLKAQSYFLPREVKEASQVHIAIDEFRQLLNERNTLWGSHQELITGFLHTIRKELDFDYDYTKQEKVFRSLLKQEYLAGRSWEVLPTITNQLASIAASSPKSNVLSVKSSLSVDETKASIPSAKVILHIERGEGAVYFYGHKVSLQPKARELLILLSNNTGLFMSMNTLIGGLWSASTVPSLPEKQIQNHKSSISSALKSLELAEKAPKGVHKNIIKAGRSGYSLGLSQEEIQIAWQFTEQPATIFFKDEIST